MDSGEGKCSLTEILLYDVIDMQEVRCIYCAATIIPKPDQGDHIIPEAMGEFEGESLFNRICPKCNAEIGKSEQQFLQCSPIQVLRQFIPGISPRQRKRGSRPVGAHGSPPPRYMTDVNGFKLLARPIHGKMQQSEFVDQLVLVDKDNRQHQTSLHPDMSAQALKAKIDKCVDGHWVEAYLDCDDAQWNHYIDLLAESYPGIRVTNQSIREPGIYWQKMHIECRFSDRVFRAIAKIALHYYLSHSRRRFYGDEQPFDGIRDFIINGGNPQEFFESARPRFVSPYGIRRGRLITAPPNWCHLLAIDESSEEIVVGMQFMVGNHCNPPVYHVRVAKLRGAILVPSFVHGHIYRYYDQDSRSKYAGMKCPVDLIGVN